ncbi:MAG: HoxN/HupN/NixA family nickel/cobalt transporter [Candidatus Omnitrophica bacterium]|nr:HoxN/HupN/NixA family nickel/cobalt transporter [Candidatus Omnitrophota bacterium]
MSGLGAVAYFFGIKHAFDADHIAAIDNVTRKLRQDEKKSVGVGLSFSLGHSTVVLLMSAVVIIFLRSSSSHMNFLKGMGGMIGTTVSALFLTLIGILNLIVLKNLYKIAKDYRQGKIEHHSIDELLNKRGLMNRFFGLLYKKIDKSWKMYPVGFLFGLGFDTASEIAILGISAAISVKSHLSIWSIMIFPLLFTAGMSMMDSLDGLAMMKVYDWAMSDALRKLFFNIFITGASVFIALFIGAIEWLQVVSIELDLNGHFFVFLKNLNFGKLGIGIIGIMLISWLVAFFYYRKILKTTQWKKID